jgi:hypothetical protein
MWYHSSFFIYSSNTSAIFQASIVLLALSHNAFSISPRLFFIAVSCAANLEDVSVGNAHQFCCISFTTNSFAKLDCSCKSPSVLFFFDNLLIVGSCAWNSLSCADFVLVNNSAHFSIHLSHAFLIHCFISHAASLAFHKLLVASKYFQALLTNLLLLLIRLLSIAQ